MTARVVATSLEREAVFVEAGKEGIVLDGISMFPVRGTVRACFVLVAAVGIESTTADS